MVLVGEANHFWKIWMGMYCLCYPLKTSEREMKAQLVCITSFNYVPSLCTLKWNGTTSTAVSILVKRWVRRVNWSTPLIFMRAKSGEIAALLPSCEMQGGCPQSMNLKGIFFSCCSVVHHLSSVLGQALRGWDLAYSWGSSFRGPLWTLFRHYMALWCCVSPHSYLGGGNANQGRLEERLGCCRAPQL